MSNLQYRQEKIQAKRKQTPWRDFVMEIASRNSLNLYKYNNLISAYPDTDRVKYIVSYREFEDIRWTKTVEFDSTRWFFECFSEVWFANAHRNVVYQQTNENSDYVSPAFWVKNGYLSFVSGNNSENILYSYVVYSNCKNVVNSKEVVNNCENIFHSSSITQSMNIYYSQCIDISNNIWFSSNLIWCTECINCTDLQNKSYCIDNIQYSKDEYLLRKENIMKNISSYEKNSSVNRSHVFDYGNDTIDNCINVIKSRNLSYARNCSCVNNGRNILLVHGVDKAENMYDVYEWWWMISDNFYAVTNSWNHAHHLYCSTMIDASSFIFYSYDLEACSFCLWCIWLKNKSYCILNKQYTKEEWYEKVDEIFTQMEKDWQLWEFFPATMNPFYFNDTAAYLINPSFTKEEVTARWYLRRDEPIKVDIPEWMEIVKTSELWEYEWFDSEWNRSINADILKKVIQDEEWNVYRIIPMEYKFLVKHGLPLPRKHWLERMKENFRIS